MSRETMVAKGAGIKRDGRRERTEASKQLIIDVAIDLIAKEGLSHVTLQRVGALAKVSSALVVFHFGSKENLLQAVLQYLDQQFDKEWTGHVRAPGLTLAQRIAGGITCAVSFAEKHPKWVSVWISFCADSRTLALYRKTALPHDKAYMAECQDRFAQLIKEGGYAGIDPAELSERINSMVFGSWLWCHLNPRERRAHLLRLNAMALLEQLFPRHFPLEKKTRSRA